MKICSRPTVVSAYLDGKAFLIERQVLRGVDQFEKAQKVDPNLQVVVDGQRRSRLAELGRFAALTLAPASLGLGLGVALAASGDPVAGMVLGGMVGLGLSSAGLKNLGLAFKAPRWKAGERYTVGKGSQPSPVPTAGATRLADLIRSNATQYPGVRHIAYLSGHGNGKAITEIPVAELPENLPPVDLTVLDACKTAQLEVISRLAPWSRHLLTSVHEVPGKGFPIEAMLAKSDDFLSLARTAAPAAVSLSLLDGVQFSRSLLPQLDVLGRQLVAELKAGNRHEIRRALAQSRNPDWLGPRVNLSDFLEKLEKRSALSAETRGAVSQARESLGETLLFTKNAHSLSFDLARGRTSDSLPEGWRNFLNEFDRNWKPLW